MGAGRAAKGGALGGFRHALFGDRTVEEAGEALAIEAPPRALDAAAVPISLALAPAFVPQVRAIHLIIDENPSPLAAVFRAGPAGDLGSSPPASG